MEFVECFLGPRQPFVLKFAAFFEHVFLNEMKEGDKGEIDNELHNTPGLFPGLNPTELCRSTRALLVENACHPLAFLPIAIHVCQVISYLVIFLLVKRQPVFFSPFHAQPNKKEAENGTDWMNFTLKWRSRCRLLLSSFSFPWFFIIEEQEFSR